MIKHLSDNNLHIWQLNTLEAPAYHDLLTNLSHDEQQRAKRFIKPSDQQRFAAARCFLRYVLARYTDCSATELDFGYAEYGKPGLKHFPHIQFNLSHSHEQVILAITLEQQVGIDIEYQQQRINVLELAQRFFSAQEFAYIQGLSGTQQTAAFYQLWTAREAYLKATGEGIRALEHVTINYPEMSLSDARWHLDSLQNWHLIPIPVANQYFSTLAVSSKQQPEIHYYADPVFAPALAGVGHTFSTVIPDVAQ
ncbi:4'-phosphopantetheinyl transferase superfamily protein [Candidatus Venteria ishoeyi]|uniref:4'-phosphopantetheinyl transferase family protein n=1 Tax=Candidatus Venteria ishoeyi TaxID=1899563 RepID=UPI0025A6275F|nr:4'-phosphopantetheinyl transferase superfamily protein [Candidatus Venteria ishoeyi]MDM8545724.1 4'-phosphopantetheinyl transferase superfamily protein [Candidatus Venteria ishoeyi]